MSTGRRNVQKLMDLISFKKTMSQRASREAQAQVEAAAAEEARLAEESRVVAIDQAEALWKAGHKVSAFSVLRQARLQHGPSAALQYEYGQKALEQGNDWAAREALHDAVDLDPTHLDALELFLRINRELPAAKGSTTAAFTALAKLLPHASGFDSEAAAFLLPSMAAVEIVDQKIRMLR